MAFDPSGRATATIGPPLCSVGFDRGDETPELRSALAGNEAAFTALYRRHRATVYRFVWLLTGSAAQAADITQDVFIELLNGSGGYDAARGSLAAYLCGVARFRAYRTMDTRMQTVDDFEAFAEAHEGIDAPALPDDHLERRRSLDTLYDAIRRLPRDSQGRTRQEQASGAVFIHDVVACYRALSVRQPRVAADAGAQGPVPDNGRYSSARWRPPIPEGR